MKNIITLLFILFLMGCSKKPIPINYGKDACHFCHMTIVDKIHATELVTDKGKVYKFDSSECLFNFQKEHKDLSYAHQLTNYYEEPTDFTNIENAYFLKSKELPSPMGANVTAFKTKTKAEEIQSEKNGEIYSFKEIKKILSD